MQDQTIITMKAPTMISINGKNYGSATSVTVINGVTYIDGKVQEGLANSPKIEIQIHGPAETVSTGSGNVGVNGDVTGNLSTMSGNARCKNVGGNVSTMSGDVRADAIAGSVKTMSGDIST